ncbi:MAG: NAD-dependent protein deacylase [Clostridiales bacterium]|nr:NAD-dependent protein deacylase [Clostridiales bacterium]
MDGMERLQAIVDKGKRIVFFGGAGVSTASGIPDFRSDFGLFKQNFGDLTPEMILSTSYFHLNPTYFFKFYREYMVHPEAKPNLAHKKLAALERAGKLRGVVTQNIDGLHKAAGNKLVYEVHGSIHENYCMDCNAFYDLKYVMGQEGIPRCSRCGGVVKPWVVLYGEAPDKYTCMGACREISNCDVLIVAGTSLEVEPAASFIWYFRGKELVVINRDATRADERATLVIHDDIETVMGGLDESKW